MNRLKIQAIFLTTSILIFSISACTTDPINSTGGAVPDIPVVTVQDPGAENLCADGIISFQHQVLPILISSCAYSGCHDAITAEDDIVLDSYENVIREVKPGDLNDSELYESIIETDPDDIMPPPPASRLKNEQIAIIRNWILQGAENTDCGTPCDSTMTSFSSDIYPLLQNYCIGCHNSNRTDGNVNIESYDKLLPYVDNQALVGTITHDAYFPIMPPSGSKMSDCRIAQIKQWIAEGAQNN